MGYKFNPFTGNFDDSGSGGATTDASLLTSGTLADARLSSNVSLDNVNNNFTAGQSITAAANTSALTASYSVTGANTTPLLDLSGTWNTTGIARGIRLNITNSAAGAGSLLADFQTGGTSCFQINPLGTTTGTGGFSFTPASNTGTFSFVSGSTGTVLFNSTSGNIFSCRADTLKSFIFASAFAVGWNGDTLLYRDAANTLAQRNGTNAQLFRIYNTFSDSANYERAFMRWNSNVLEIGTEAAGTGTANRNISLKIGTQTTGVTLSPAGTGVNLDARSISSQGQGSLTASTLAGITLCNYTSGAADPTTTTIPSGNWQVYRNTTTGVVKLWANNAGTLVSVALA